VSALKNVVVHAGPAPTNVLHAGIVDTLVCEMP